MGENQVQGTRYSFGSRDKIPPCSNKAIPRRLRYSEILYRRVPQEDAKRHLNDYPDSCVKNVRKTTRKSRDYTI